jgi:uncharacterized protein HemY
VRKSHAIGLAKIAEKRGELERAQALRAEADQICPEPPEDPKLLKAFQQALGKRDPDAARDALRKLFGKGGRRRTKQ